MFMLVCSLCVCTAKFCASFSVCSHKAHVCAVYLCVHIAFMFIQLCLHMCVPSLPVFSEGLGGEARDERTRERK